MNIQQFKFSEAFNNSKGKSAIGLVCAFLLILSSCIVFVFSGFAKYGEGMMYATGFSAIGGGLLGIRRFTKDKELVNVETESQTSKTE